jgi:hypothetical protein
MTRPKRAKAVPVTPPNTIRRPKKVEEILADLEATAPSAPEPPPPSTKAIEEEMTAKTIGKDEDLAGAPTPSSTLASMLAASANAANGAAKSRPGAFAALPSEEDDEDEDEDDEDEDDEDLDDEDDDEDLDDDLDEDEDEDEVASSFDEDDETPAPKRGRPAKKAPAKKATPAPRGSGGPGAGRVMPMHPASSPFGFGTGAPVRLPARIQNEKIQQNLSEYDEMLASIDFDASKNHKILLLRVKPEWDPVTGDRLAGYLEEFRRPVTAEEIRAKYGGGEYTLTLQGPSAPDGSGRMTFKKSKNIEIAGDPIPVKNPRAGHHATAAQSASAKASEDAQLQLVKQVMESKDRDAQRLWAEQQDLKKMLLQTMSKSDNGMKDVVASAINGGGDLRRELMEERRLQEERIRAEREERQRELDRLTAERKRELEMAQAQHDKQLEIMRMQNERQLEQMRLENQRIMEEMRQRTTTESSASRDLLLFMQRMEAEKAATVQKQQELFLAQQQRQQELATQQATKQQEFLLQQQMQGQQMLLAQMQSAQQTKEQFLMEMLKESRNKKDDFFSTMEKMQQFKKLMGAMNGEEEDTRERWEKVLDRVGEAAPGIVAVASSFLQSRAQQQAAQQVAPVEQRVLPGSVAVAEVELPAPRQLPPKKAKASPPPPKPAPAYDDEPGFRRLVEDRKTDQKAERKASAPAKPKPPASAPSASAPPASAPPAPSVTSSVLGATQPAAEGENPLADFAFPPDGTSMVDSISLLVQNIDLAIQRDYSAKRIYDEVVSKFPLEVLTVLRLASAEQMIEILEQRAPASWIVNSLVGTKRIEELHALLVGG